MIKRIYLLLTCLAVFSHLVAKDKDDIVFFAQTYCEKTQVEPGDSCLVSYVLYSSVPFSSIQCTGDFKVRNATVRPIIFSRNKTTKIVEQDNRKLYRMVWAQYMVYPKRDGKIKIPAQTFEARFVYHKETMPNYYSIYYGRPSNTLVDKEAVSPRRYILVSEKLKSAIHLRRGSDRRIVSAVQENAEDTIAPLDTDKNAI